MMYPYMTLADETENGGTQRRFKDRFHMTFEQNLFLAKKKWDENVYCGMRMENRAVTFPQTRTILDGVNVPSVQLDDIQAILIRNRISSTNSPKAGYGTRAAGYLAG
ncbi:hypothetical protein [Frisingicoccus sp.]|uniref:hypothetical protein n=1 Tax=Frisingicoccus sp. TaxID=1918627 RepID=UPI003AB8C125